jgi:hypothetical protein
LNGQSARSYGTAHVWWDAGKGGILPLQEEYDDPTGLVGIVNAKGFVHAGGHAFFEPLGVNGRACITCHQPSNAMSLSAASAQTRWTETQGKDPLFAAIDGSNCPDLPQAMANSHSLLLDRGLFRISLPWPPKNVDAPEFAIEIVRDPTGCNKSLKYGLHSPEPSISVYRRPRVAANLRHVLSGPAGISFMADSREPSLRTQAISAALIHEEAKAQPDEEQLRQIIDFESQIYVAQYSHILGGLTEETDGPRLGRENLSVADSGLPPAHSFASWKWPDLSPGLQREFRESVARGSDVFSNHCASCHQPGTTRWKDVGTTNVANESQAAPDLPLFRVTCKDSATPHAVYGRTIYTQDPGRALISGKCADVGAIVVPQFRGLAARAPYFSNGSSKTLRDVVDFYEQRLGMDLKERDKQDLVNFLGVL